MTFGERPDAPSHSKTNYQPSDLRRCGTRSNPGCEAVYRLDAGSGAAPAITPDGASIMLGSQFGFQLTPVDGILVSRQNSKDGGEGVALDPLEGPVSSTEVAVVALREFSGGSFRIGGIRQVANHHRDLIA